jgi:hypothetical protein
MTRATSGACPSGGGVSAKTDLFGELRTLGGHNREIVIGAQIAFENLQFLAVF